MLLLHAGRLLAIGTLLLSFAPSPAAALPTRTLEDGRFSGVLLDAGRVVWLDEDRATPRLRLFDGATRTLEDQGTTSEVQLDDGFVVWRRDLAGSRELRFFDGSSIRTLDEVTGIDQTISEVALDDGVVFWRSKDRQDEVLQYFDGSRTLALDSVNGNQSFGSVFFDEGVLVWETVDGVERTLKRFDGTGTTPSLLDAVDGRQKTFGRVVFADGTVIWERLEGVNEELFYSGPAGILRLDEANSFGVSFGAIALADGFAVWERVEPNRVRLEGFNGVFSNLDSFEGLFEERGLLLVDGGAALWESIGSTGRDLLYSAGGAGAPLDTASNFVGEAFGQVVLQDATPAWEHIRRSETVLKTLAGFVVPLDDDGPVSGLQVDQTSVAWVRGRDPLLRLFDGAIRRDLDDRAPFSDVQLVDSALVWQNGQGELRFFDGSGISKLDDSFRAREVQTDEGYVVWVRAQGASRELLFAPEPGSAALALASLVAVGVLSRRTGAPRG